MKKEKGNKQCEIVPFGKFPHFAIEIAKEVLEKTYNLEVIENDPSPIPRWAFTEFRGQYSAQALIYFLKKRKKSSYALGLIDKDIYSKDYYFIYGQAIPREVAVLSIYRLQGERNKFKTRIKKEITHEVGHLLGLSHCPDQNCVMAFSNSVEEVDQKEAALCQECKDKLETIL